MTDNYRISIKVAGESGQGINSIGEVVARALKEAGYFTFGYREYPSVIKGGHAFHQTDFSDKPINSSSKNVDVLVCFSRVSFHEYLKSLKENGQVLHMLQQLELTEEEQKLVHEKNIYIKYIDAEQIAKSTGGTAIMANTVLVGVLWKLLNLSADPLISVIRAQFADKPKYVNPNIQALKKGYDTNLDGLNFFKIHFEKQEKRKTDALLTGNQILALGSVAAGVRAYFAYPMTPSSSILSFMADIYHETGILVKQLDDEIAVAQTAIGAMFMGTRALVGTSGGGFDLMTESISLAGITETPFVCILGQRPGPATGMPTWTSASDLNLAVYAGHGEFPRCVLSLSDSKSAYNLIQKAFNIAEKYQIPVIVLTEKQIAESLYQLENLDPDEKIERYLLSENALKLVVSTDRYKITDSGISPRWNPGDSEAVYVGNSDEHLEDGTLTEEALPSLLMNQKRLRKIKTLENELPEPILIGPKKSELTFVGWGSTRNTIEDVIPIWNTKHPNKSINYLHYEFIYPLKTGKLTELASEKQKLVPVEANATSQLSALITQQTGVVFKDKLLKFDGRPFFIEDIFDFLEERFKK